MTASTSPVRTQHRRICTALFAVASLTLVAGCSDGDGSSSPSSSTAATPNEASILNAATTNGIVEHFRDAGLPATGPHDVSAATCRSAHCSAATATQETTVAAFNTTREATLYYQTHAGAFLVQNFVVTFSPAVTPSDKAQYENIITRALK